MRDGADVDRSRCRNTAVENDIYPVEYRDADCSGRSLATLMVAWVGAAMVASVLLRWKYMWIALTILTLLFLFACGYAACNARRAHERSLANEEARILERRRRDGNIQSVSGAVDNFSEITDPPAYQTYWITDLPPPYAVVIGAGSQSPQSPTPPLPPPMPRSSYSEPASLSTNMKPPPPYSIAVQSSLNGTSRMTNESSDTVNHVHASSSVEHRSISLNEATNSQVEQVVPISSVEWNNAADGKTSIEQTRNEDENSSNNSHTVLSSGTHSLLSNIINCTFGRGQRRNNIEQNTNLQTTTSNTTASNRDRIVADISQLNNRDNTGSEINTSSL